MTTTDQDIKELIDHYKLLKSFLKVDRSLQKQYWFEGMETKEYCVRYDAINKRIAELENE